MYTKLENTLSVLRRSASAANVCCSAIREKLIAAYCRALEKARSSRGTIISDLDLSMIPNYVSYKSALIREKMLLQHACLILTAMIVILFITSRFEISNLTEQLRQKEFILAPGVTDFVPVAPQVVPDSYVQHAVSDYVTTLGNTNPINIQERYQQLSSSMSPALQIQFASESKDWIEKVKAENISEMVTILGKVIEADNKGNYHAVVSTRTDTFVGRESIGYRNEAIEISLKLIPPEQGKRWFLEITSLARVSTDAYEKAKGLGGQRHGK